MPQTNALTKRASENLTSPREGKRGSPKKEKEGKLLSQSRRRLCSAALHNMVTALKPQPSPVYTDRLVHGHNTALVQQIFPSRTRLLNAARKPSKDWCLRSISSQPPAAGMPRTPAAPSPANLPSEAAELPSCCSGLCEPPGSRFLLPPSCWQILEIFPTFPFASPFPTSLCSLAHSCGLQQVANHKTQTIFHLCSKAILGT